ncbi:MAG: hypothetical protein GY754_16090 [bacterium]|nr:hypothetical protein [bacterium]
MKYIRIILILTVAIYLQSCTGCKDGAHQEKEPNNSFALATPLETNKTIDGFIESRDDKDFYKLTFPGDTVLDIGLTAIKGINHAIEIWQGDSPELVKLVDDNRKSSSERIANFYAQRGTYYIAVVHGERDKKKGNKETPYKLSVSSRAPGMEEVEANDNLSTACQVSEGSEIKGYFSPAYNRLNYSKENPLREEDWYRIQVDLEPETPRLMNVSLTGVKGINSILAIYDGDNNRIAFANNGISGVPEDIKGIGITESGEYFIQVTSEGYNANPNESYFLQIAFTEFDAAVEMEPNNSISKANKIQENQVSGKIDSTTDRDYFVYNAATPGSLYRVELAPPVDLDMKMILFNGQKKKLMEINNGPKGEREIHPNLFMPGDFFIAVSSRKTGYSREGDYTLSVTKIEDAAGYESEPNDNKKRAGTIKNNQIKGFVSRKDDKDFYLLNYGQTVKQRFEVLGVKDGEISVSVTDPLGYVIKSVTIKGDTPKTFSEMIDKKGYLIVEPIKANYDSPYTINLK